MSSNLASLAGGEEVNLAQGVAQGEGGCDQVRFAFMLYRHYLFSFCFKVVPIP
jgi:hypothetical protein